MTQKVAQAQCWAGGVSLLRPQGGWTRLSQAVSAALLVMIGASVQAADLDVINCSSWKIRASIDYRSHVCSDDEAKLIEPYQKFHVSSGGCWLKAVTIWVDDASGAPKPNPKELAIWRKRYDDGETADWVWRVGVKKDGEISVGHMNHRYSDTESYVRAFHRYRDLDPRAP